MISAASLLFLFSIILLLLLRRFFKSPLFPFFPTEQMVCQIVTREGERERFRHNSSKGFGNKNAIFLKGKK